MGWGSNAFGQLNQPVGVGQLRDITLGLRHTSALRTDGTVVCWGHDGFNQVGSLPAGLSSVVAIHAGDNHTIALRADGTVVCWGDNIFEQCDVPVGLAPVVGVSAGESTSGALHADGTVTLWGWDSSDGRLNVPTDLGSVTKLELGMTFGTVLRADGTVGYWGTLSPVIDASAVLRDLAAGFGHVLGLRPDGTVQAWGANGSGQSTIPAGLTDVAAVAAGRLHSLALKQDGSVVCWGSNVRGQAPNPAPITANGQQVAAGEEFSYGLTLAGGIAAPSIVVVSSTDPVCGLNNGAIDTTVANADFVFWTGPSGFFRNGADLTGLAAGAYTVTAVGHGGSVSQVVTLTAQSDTTAPVVTSYDASESLAASIDCTAAVPDFTASVVAEDNCTAAAALVITQLPAAGTALGLGAHDITITVADGSDNEATVTAVFTVTGTAVSYYVDADSDAFGAGEAVVYCNTATPPGYATNNGDCDDQQFLYADNDGDTFGAGAPVACGVPTNTDCDDANNQVYPGRAEVCNGIDDNCAGGVDDGLMFNTYYEDADADTYGRSTDAGESSCTPVAGKVANNLDCNDADSTTYPGAPEVCGNILVDNDCDGVNTEEEASDRSTFYRDADGDGFTGPETGLFCTAPTGYEASPEGDCNDASGAIHPGAVENCANDGTDNDCDGEANSDAEAADSNLYWLDEDLDNFGSPASSAQSCQNLPPAGYSVVSTDCNDLNAAVHPGASEVCNALDDDCDGAVDNGLTFVTYYADADADGYGDPVSAGVLACNPVPGKAGDNTDCNDGDASVNPGAIENCANLAVDNDCDGSTAEDEAIDRTTFYPDLDGDGAGDPAGPTVVACDAPAGHVLNADDGCPSDAAKVAPGACGCGQPDTDSNSDGIADCNSLIVRLTPERVSVQPGTQFTLRVSSVTTLRSVAYQLGMHFDPSRLTLTAVTPAPGTPFDLQLAATIDNAAGTVVYMAGVSSLDGFFAGGASLFELHFTASAATGCDLAGAITFGNVGSIESFFVLEGVIRLDPITEGLAAFSIDGTPPMITGAGMTSGALADCTAPVPDFRHLPVDGCSTANELVITQNPAPGTAAGLGVTDVTVVATDAAGNTNFAVLPFTVTGDPVVYYMDADGDGFGAGSPTTACAPIFGSVDNGADCNDTNPSVYPGSPELCGDALDNDCDGQLNEGCTVFTLRLASDAPSVSAGGTFTVRASCTAPAAALSGAQITLHFDATRLRLEAVDPVGGNPLDFELVEQIDNSAGTLRYALGCLSTDCGLTQAADLCDLTFTVLPSASLCGATELVAFGPVGAFTTRFTRLADAAPIVPALTNLPSINLDSVPPILSGVPADISVPTDAGSTFGALVSLPTVTASDNCDGPVAVTATGIPSGSIFAIGATTVTWTATDAAGNTATSSRTVTVGDYQLLDAVVSFSNPQLGASRHALRIGAGAAVEVVDTLIPAWSGTPPTTPTSATVTVHVPVASSYPCVSAKSVGATVSGGAVRASHTLTDTAAASVSGSRYRAEFVLLSGDSNDDDMVEILDYGNWLVDRSMPGDSARAPEARSNYNGDGLVIQSDVGLVVAYFFRVGESCTQGADAPRTPRDRIHVKELRRMGRGDLAAADLNHDGWVDTRDMQMALQGGGGAQPRPEHDLRVEW